MTLTRRLPPMGLSGPVADPELDPALKRVGQGFRAVRRAGSLLLWTALAGCVQTVLLALPGRGKAMLPRLYWAGACRLVGLRVRVIGTAADRVDGRPVLYVSNHSSWLDIPALGSALETCFVAKAEVGRWPVIRTVAWWGRTVFVSRRASGTGRERDAMRARFESGDHLILFPEGTSSDGARVLPFRSSFFALAEPSAVGVPPFVQPISIVFDRLDGLPMGRATRPVSSWYGAMELGSHFWQLSGHRELRATILLHAPIDPESFPSRKALSRAVWQVVADGAAALRQNRPAAPLRAPAPEREPAAGELLDTDTSANARIPLISS